MKEKLKFVRFRKKGSTFLYLFFLLIAFLGPGCRDKCKKISCVEGECLDGTCECNPGFFGELCNLALNSNYNNNFALTEDCTSGSDFYDVAVQASPDNNIDIKLTGLWEQSNKTVIAQVNQDAHSFTVSRQPLGTKEITGQGTVDDVFEEINLSYQIYQSGASQPFEQCTATLLKK